MSADSTNTGLVLKADDISEMSALSATTFSRNFNTQSDFSAATSSTRSKILTASKNRALLSSIRWLLSLDSLLRLWQGLPPPTSIPVIPGTLPMAFRKSPSLNFFTSLQNSVPGNFLLSNLLQSGLFSTATTWCGSTPAFCRATLKPPIPAKRSMTSSFWFSSFPSCDPDGGVWIPWSASRMASSCPARVSLEEMHIPPPVSQASLQVTTGSTRAFRSNWARGSIASSKSISCCSAPLITISSAPLAISTKITSITENKHLRNWRMWTAFPAYTCKAFLGTFLSDLIQEPNPYRSRLRFALVLSTPFFPSINEPRRSASLTRFNAFSALTGMPHQAYAFRNYSCSSAGFPSNSATTHFSTCSITVVSSK